MSLAVPKLDEESLRASQKIVEDKTENVFSDDHIEAMFAEFGKKAKDGLLERADFVPVLTALFDEPEEEQVQLILQNDFFLDRMFSFLDTDKSGKLSHKQLADGVCSMFSHSDDDMCKFKFAVYDVEGNGSITQDGMFQVIFSFVKTYLTLQEQERADDPEELKTFQEAKEIVLGEVGQSKLREMVSWAFEATDNSHDNLITFAEFEKSYHANEELFDWKGISEDLVDEMDSAVENAQKEQAEKK